MKLNFVAIPITSENKMIIIKKKKKKKKKNLAQVTAIITTSLDSLAGNLPKTNFINFSSPTHWIWVACDLPLNKFIPTDSRNILSYLPYIHVKKKESHPGNSYLFTTHQKILKKSKLDKAPPLNCMQPPTAESKPRQTLKQTNTQRIVYIIIQVKNTTNSTLYTFFTLVKIFANFGKNTNWTNCQSGF